MEIFYTHKAIADLKVLPKTDQKRIASKMRFYVSARDPLRFSKKLANSRLGESRFRIGNYRIIFDVADSKILILKIARRDKVYK